MRRKKIKAIVPPVQQRTVGKFPPHAQQGVRQEPGTDQYPNSDGPTPKQALAAAIQQLGPDATGAELGKFIKKHFNLDCNFIIAYSASDFKETHATRIGKKAG